MNHQSSFHTQYAVQSGPHRIVVHATREPDRRRPVAVLLHGTGYVAQVWEGVVPALAETHTVLALDRRGHGLSDQPDEGYDFADFAADLEAVVDALEVRAAFGVGHSAGATDLLLCAGRRPEAFSRLFVAEPTVMLPRADVVPDRPLGPIPHAMLEKVKRRRSVFPNRDAAAEHLGRTPGFAGWPPALLGAFLDHGLIEKDAQLHLRCRPSTEAAMLLPILSGDGAIVYTLSAVRGVARDQVPRALDAKRALRAGLSPHVRCGPSALARLLRAGLLVGTLRGAAAP